LRKEAQDSAVFAAESCGVAAPGRAETAAAVAAAIGAPERTVEAWLGGEASPSLGWALALVGAYGPAALAAMFETPPGWLDDAARAARRAELEAAMAELARQRAEM